MPARRDLDRLYDIGSQLAPAIHQAQNWPYDVPHAQYDASLWPPHDVGGQPDAPVRYAPSPPVARSGSTGPNRPARAHRATTWSCASSRTRRPCTT